MPPRQRRILVAHGIVIGRPLGQDREIGELREIELIERLAVISVCGRLAAVRVAAEEYLVEVELEDLMLVQRMPALPGEDRFLGLARVAALVAHEQVFGYLLGERK